MTSSNSNAASDLRSFFGSSDRLFRSAMWGNNDTDWGYAMMQHYHQQSALIPAATSTSMAASDNPHLFHGNLSIPRKIHFVWVGPKPLPLQQQQQDDQSFLDGLDTNIDTSTTTAVHGWNSPMRSWLVHHNNNNNYEYCFWTDDTIKSLERPLYNEAAYQYALQESQYGMASDILRLELLYRFGGIYVDIDYYCVASLEGLLQSFFCSNTTTTTTTTTGLVCGASSTGCVEINNGLILSSPQHNLIWQMMQDIHTWYQEYSSSLLLQQTTTIHDTPLQLVASFLDESSRMALQQGTKQRRLGPMDVIRHTGPGLWTRVIGAALLEYETTNNDTAVLVLPSRVFHPVPNDFAKRGIEKKDMNAFVVPGETRAIHLWCSSWQ